MSRNLIAFVSMVAATLGLSVSSAGAAISQITVTAEQNQSRVSFFELRGGPGAVIGDNRLLIENSRNRPAKVRVKSVDAQTAQNLGFAYELDGLASEGPTKWIRTGRRVVTVPAGGEVSVPVEVRVPDDAPAGDYLSGISVEPRGQQSETNPEEGIAVASTRRYAIGALVTVPGPRHPEARLTAASVGREPAGVTFYVDAENTGNVLLREVTGRVRVTHDGRRVASARLGPGTFVTGTSFSYPLLAASEEPPEGREYRVQAVLRYGDETARLDETVVFGGEAAERQEEFGGPAADDGIPLWLVLAIAAILLAAAIAVVLARRRRWAPLGPGEALARLRIELENARDSGQPVSVVRVSPRAGGDELLSPLLIEILPRARPQDAICDLGQGNVMIIAPQFDAAEAAGLATELRRVVAGSERLNSTAIAVGTVTADNGDDAVEVIARAQQSSCAAFDESPDLSSAGL